MDIFTAPVAKMTSIRLLIIGRPASTWARSLREEASPPLEIDHARLPSAGIRLFETTPADLIIIADDKGGSRVEILANAIRNRPLGELTPILMLAPLPPEPLDEKIQSLDLVGWLPPEAPPAAILELVGHALDFDLLTSSALHQESTAASLTPLASAPLPPEQQDPHGRASYFDGELVLEPLDLPAPSQARPIARSSIFRSITTDTSPDALSHDELRRKLKAVRHEDYYSILEIRRGAQGQTVREAFHRLRHRFDPQHLPFELAHQFHAELQEIADALEDAFAVLGDPDLREPYLRHTVT